MRSNYIIVSYLFLCLSFLKAQDTTRLNLIQRTFDFPYDSTKQNQSKAPNNVWSPVFKITKNFDSFKINIPDGYELGLYQISETLTSNTISKISTPIALLEKKYDRDSAYLLFDENRDSSFLDEQLMVIHYDSIYHLVLSFEGRSKEFEFFVNKDYEGRSGIEKIKARSLNFYELRFWEEEKLFKAYLTLTVGTSYLRLDHESITEAKRKRVYNLGELFECGGKIFKLLQCDIEHGTIQLIEYDKQQKIYDPTEGHFVDMEVVNRAIDEAPDGKYHLLYFWGHWCGPCKVNMHKTLAIQDAIQLSGQIKMSYFPLNISKGDLERTKTYISKNGLSERQFFHSFDMKDKEKDMIDYLKIKRFPTYLLLNPQGKVLYRGSNQADDLMSYLKDLGLID